MRFEWKVNGSFEQIDAMISDFQDIIESCADDDLGTGWMDDEEIRKISATSNTYGWAGVNSIVILTPTNLIFIGRTTAFEASVRREIGGMPVLEMLLEKHGHLLTPDMYSGEADEVLWHNAGGDFNKSTFVEVAQKAFELAQKGELRKLAQQAWAARMVTGRYIRTDEDIDRAQEAWNTYPQAAKNAIAALALPGWVCGDDATGAIEKLDKMLQL